MKITGHIKAIIKHPIKYVEFLLLKIPAYQKRVFDREKRKIKKFTKEIEDDIVRASQILKKINAKQIALGWSRQKRRQFWRDFEKNDLFREDVFNSLVKDRTAENDESLLPK